MDKNRQRSKEMTEAGEGSPGWTKKRETCRLCDDKTSANPLRIEKKEVDLLWANFQVK